MMCSRKTLKLASCAALLPFVWLGWTALLCAQDPAPAAKPFNFAEASRNVPKPREVYPNVKRDMIPMDLKITSDEIVASDTDPAKKLRKITAHFNSLKLDGRVWGIHA